MNIIKSNCSHYDLFQGSNFFAPKKKHPAFKQTSSFSLCYFEVKFFKLFLINVSQI